MITDKINFVRRNQYSGKNIYKTVEKEFNNQRHVDNFIAYMERKGWKCL
jgi:hypothetical protein